jgi:hypothetical protein
MGGVSARAGDLHGRRPFHDFAFDECAELLRRRLSGLEIRRDHALAVCRIRHDGLHSGAALSRSRVDPASARTLPAFTWGHAVTEFSNMS